MPVVTFEKSFADGRAEKIRDVCEVYGVELFAKSAPLDPNHREVLVRTQADRGALGMIRVDTMDKLERTLRSWGLRPLDAENQDRVAIERRALGPTATSEWDVVIGAVPPELMSAIEDEITGTIVAETPEPRVVPAAGGMEPAEPWKIKDPPDWWQAALTTPGETNADNDGIFLLGYDAVDLGKVARIGWEPRDEGWRPEVPEEFVGVVHLYVDLDLRLSVPATRETATQIAKAWTRVNARRNMKNLQ